MLTRCAASIGAVVAIAALALTTVAGQGAPAPELKEQDVYREIGYLPMRDGVELAYVVWRSKKEGRYPTLVSYSPYATHGASFANAQPYLEHGYAYVGANIRGTGCSEGHCRCRCPR
jgi:predicted acyl esterase